MNRTIQVSHTSQGQAMRAARRSWLAAALGLCVTLSAGAVPAQEWEFSTLPPGLLPEELATLDEFGVYSVPITAADAEHLVGLWKQLRANRVNGPVQNTLDGKGALLRGKMDVQSCPAIDHSQDRLASYHQGWTAHAVLTYTFFLKNKTELGVEVTGAEAEVVNGVNTSKVQRKVDAELHWLPELDTLYVVVSNFINPLLAGPQVEVGEYLVKGRALTTFSASSTTVDSSFGESGLDISATTEMVSGKRRLKVQVDGCSYALDYGIFSAIRSNFGDDLEWSFKAEWISDTDLFYEEEIAVVDQIVCASRRQIGFDFDLKDSIQPGFNSSGSAGCVATTGQLPVRVEWRAIPTFNQITQEDEGLTAKLRFFSRKKPDGTAVSWYQPRFATMLNWYLKAAAIGDGGGGILVDNQATGPMQTAKINVREF